MTEAEWLAATEPCSMLEYVLKGKLAERKLRLFSCACCRIWNREKPIEGIDDLIDLAERCADGLAARGELEERVARVANPAPFSVELWDAVWLHSTLGWDDPLIAAIAVSGQTPLFAQLLRCVAGNPYPRESAGRSRWGSTILMGMLKLISGSPYYTPPKDVEGLPAFPFDIEWRTSTVAAIARGIYESRDFTPMPILADALQDAGCEQEDILNHCRFGGPHVRGCWVVDLVLGKS
jgi:hypothetical protein